MERRKESDRYADRTESAQPPPSISLSLVPSGASQLSCPARPENPHPSVNYLQRHHDNPVTIPPSASPIQALQQAHVDAG